MSNNVAVYLIYCAEKLFVPSVSEMINVDLGVNVVTYGNSYNGVTHRTSVILIADLYSTSSRETFPTEQQKSEINQMVFQCLWN